MLAGQNFMVLINLPRNWIGRIKKNTVWSDDRRECLQIKTSILVEKRCVCNCEWQGYVHMANDLHTYFLCGFCTVLGVYTKPSGTFSCSHSHVPTTSSCVHVRLPFPSIFYAIHLDRSTVRYYSFLCFSFPYGKRRGCQLHAKYITTYVTNGGMFRG